MKKGKKIWNRLLSLVLCLVMVTGMFAGMGMEAKASISLYPKDFTAFDDYQVLGTAVLDKNAEEMEELVGTGPDTRPTEAAAPTVAIKSLY